MTAPPRPDCTMCWVLAKRCLCLAYIEHLERYIEQLEATQRSLAHAAADACEQAAEPWGWP